LIDANEAQDATANELLAADTADTSLATEGDIIDLSEFLDSADASDYAADDDDEDAAVVEDQSGSDDFDDLDDLSSLLDGLESDVDLAEEMQAKLGMAEAFVEMGDASAAKEALNEVIEAGDASHRQSARELLAKLGM